MMILCKEYDKYRGRGTIHYIAARNVTGRDLQLLSLRSRLNPELKYYATRLDETMSENEVLLLFKSKEVYEEPAFARI